MSAVARRYFSVRREGGDAKKRRQYLPPDRQYLVTRNGESGAHTRNGPTVSLLLRCSGASVPGLSAGVECAKICAAPRPWRTQRLHLNVSTTKALCLNVSTTEALCPTCLRLGVRCLTCP